MSFNLKGTVYETNCVLSTPATSSADISPSPRPADGSGKCSLTMAVSHGQQMIAAASQAKIWLSEINGRTSSHVNDPSGLHCSDHNIHDSVSRN